MITESRLGREAKSLMTLFVISCMFFYGFVSMHANHTQSPNAIFSDTVLDPSFHTPQSAKERSTVQVELIKAVNNACRTAR